MGLRFSYLLLAGLTALLALAPLSLAGDPTREQYVDRSEVVCKVALDRTTPILRQAARSLKRNSVVASGRQYLRAARIFHASHQKLAQVQRPPDDAPLLGIWLEKLRDEVVLLENAGNSLVAGERVRAQRALSKFVQAGGKANNVVFGFRFNYCLFKVSRIG